MAVPEVGSALPRVAVGLFSPFFAFLALGNSVNTQFTLQAVFINLILTCLPFSVLELVSRQGSEWNIWSENQQKEWKIEYENQH